MDKSKYQTIVKQVDFSKAKRTRAKESTSQSRDSKNRKQIEKIYKTASLFNDDEKEFLVYAFGLRQMQQFFTLTANFLQMKKPIFSKTFENTGFRSDLDWIQTSNLLSRNQVRYSVAPRGLNAGANIGLFGFYANLFFILFKKSSHRI